MTTIPTAAIKAADRATGGLLGASRTETALQAALPHLLPGWCVTYEPNGDATIWMLGTPAHPNRPEPVMYRRLATAVQFDQLAALLPGDRTDEEDPS